MSLGRLHALKQSNRINSAVVIFLHGSGDCGQGILNWVKFLLGENYSLPHIKFLFPTAPVRPYTPNGGNPSNVWFDRLDITPFVPEHNETLFSIKDEINNLIKGIVTQGIPMNRIIIGGFSMGGALAFHTAYRFCPGLKGCFTLSSFLNNQSGVYNEIKALDTPLYMRHGDRDTMVPIEWGKKTYEELQKLGVKGEFIPVKNCLHEMKKKELEDLMAWIEKLLPPLPSDK